MTGAPFGILLTGGSSSRLGRDKATLDVTGEPLAKRVAGVLSGATGDAVEVGGGHSGLPSVVEEPAGTGPLAAVVAGWRELVRRTGEKRPAVVLACDLPDVSAELVRWLASHPAAGSVVPVVGGVAQPLCARWSARDLGRAAARLAAGERWLRDLFDDSAYVGEEGWSAVASATTMDDVDTPGDLSRRCLAPPEGDDWVGLSRRPLPTDAAVGWAARPDCGAVVTFMGTVRDHAEGRDGVETLTYEAYEDPALDRMAAVVAEARRRWPSLARVAVLHRLGALAVGDTAVTVVASAAHRQEAFAAGGFLIDTVKETVPIWKHERWRDGEGWGTGAQPVRSV